MREFNRVWEFSSVFEEGFVVSEVYDFFDIAAKPVVLDCCKFYNFELILLDLMNFDPDWMYLS